MFVPSGCPAADLGVIESALAADVAAASAWATPRSRQALAYAGRIDAANPETLVAELAAGTFDMLVTFTRCSGSEEVFTAGQAAAVAAALTDGRLKKVMVW